MNKRTKTTAALTAAMMVVLACSISYSGELSEEEKLQTAVAQTISAEQVDPKKDTQQPLPTITLASTYTQVSDPTQTPLPCNKAEFISETIEDDTEFNANAPFTKTWRLKNIGTCTWNTNYRLVYSSGDKMSGPVSKNLPQSVAPGEQIDISVDLTAPASEGTYKGFWKVADEKGQFFVNTIWVKIKVKPIPLNTYNLTLNIDMDEGGSIWGNGDMYPGEYATGDVFANFGLQMFAAFDINSIPSNAIIKEVKVDFTNYDTMGNPFDDLGCLRLYPHTYRPLSADDYKSQAVTGAVVHWCTLGEISTYSVESDLADYLQSRLGNSYIPVWLQFNEHKTDGDNSNDVIGFIAVNLEVKYEAP